MAIEIFNRYENKFLLNNEQFDAIKILLNEKMTLDEHSKDNLCYSVSNLYYDIPSNINSMPKLKYKDNLRLRYYNHPNDDDFVNLEIKKTCFGIVSKRRISLKFNDARLFLETHKLPNVDYKYNTQVANEIIYMLNKYGLIPTIHLSYNRIAYMGGNNRDLRITFDKNIKSKSCCADATLIDDYDEILPEGYFLMKIKSYNNIPRWLTTALSKNDLYQTVIEKSDKEIYLPTIISNKGLLGQLRRPSIKPLIFQI